MILLIIIKKILKYRIEKRYCIFQFSVGQIYKKIEIININIKYKNI